MSPEAQSLFFALRLDNDFCREYNALKYKAA
jgi:hypothetical protein